jgi:hypothetical protein
LTDVIRGWSLSASWTPDEARADCRGIPITLLLRLNLAGT